MTDDGYEHHWYNWKSVSAWSKQSSCKNEKSWGSFKGVKMASSIFSFKRPLGSFSEEYGSPPPAPRPSQPRHMDELGHLRAWIEAYGFLVDIIEAILKFPVHSSGKWAKFTPFMPIRKFKNRLNDVK